MQKEERILVADDHEIVRMGIIRMIEKLKPNAQLFEVNDYSALYDIISKQTFTFPPFTSTFYLFPTFPPSPPSYISI